MPLVISGSGSSASGPRNIGALGDVSWDHSVGPGAIRGWGSAAFNTVAGGETFTVTEDGVSAVITLANTDITPTLVCAKINAGTGLGTPCAVDGTQLILTGYSIAVSGVSAALFAKIGLPNMSRDKDLTAETSIQPTINTFGDEGDQISNSISVPAGANRVSLWVGLDTDEDYENGAGVIFTLAWGNGTDGVAYDAVFASSIQAVIGAQDEIPTRRASPDLITQTGMVQGFRTVRLHEATVPAGVTSLYLVLIGCTEEDAGPVFTPPTVNARYRFGSRLWASCT